MKKLYSILSLIIIGFSADAQIIDFPDAALKYQLLMSSPDYYIAKDLAGNYFKIDANDDGEIEASEALQVGAIDVSSYPDIDDMNGIENFTNLTALSTPYTVSVVNFTGLVNLEILNINSNELTSLDVSGLSSLTYLNVEDGTLTSLNLGSLPNLHEVICTSNLLTTLDVSGLTNLHRLACDRNQLTTLTIGGLSNLQDLTCNENQLSTLDLTGLVSLTVLVIADNQISSINLNGLNNLDILWMANNSVASLDLSGLTTLTRLDCSANLLTTLDVSNQPNMIDLYCLQNQLTTLNIKNGANEAFSFYENPSLIYICADDNQLTPVATMIGIAGITNCHVNSYCSFTPGGTFYTIQGTTRFDQSNNGCDAADTIFPRLKFSIANGSNTGTLISDDSGNFSIPVQAGVHTITPVFENPAFYSVSPTSLPLDFPTQTSPFLQNFCITPIGIHNDLEISIIPLNVARPGFDANYKIIYKNKGTGLQNGTVDLSFNDAVLDLVSAVPVNNAASTNNLSWNFSNLQPFQTREILVTMNVNSPMETPAVNNGDVLNYLATVTGATDETPNDNSTALNQTVVNSFDPNDKSCLEGNTITPAMVGQYVHYMIRFENTGTFAAENIVVKDIIDTAKFDISSLVPLHGSHDFVTRITDTNKVEFIFENINLPFDDANNDGYVAFKIKTLPTLVLGNSFTNTASIYFDYNFPIVTDPATTVIQALAIPDFDFNSFFTLSPVPVKSVLTITAKQYSTISSVKIYNTLGQLVQVDANPNQTIDVSGLKPGSYFISLVTDKGKSTATFVKE